MQAIEAIPLFRTRSTGGGAAMAAKTSTAPTFSLTFEPEPAPIAEPIEPAPLDAGQLAYYKHYVGKVVSDAQMTGLILAANRYGFQITFEAQGDWRNACDYLVTSARGRGHI